MIYLEFLITNVDLIITIILIIFISCVVLYLIILISSFAFMFSFKSKIKDTKDKLFTFLGEKNDSLHILIGNLKVDEKTYSIIDNYLKKKDFLKNIKLSDLFQINQYLDLILEEITKFIINNEDNDVKKENVKIISIIGNLDKNIFKETKLYNNYVVGYNYWYEFFSTKWVKKIFHVKKYDSIK